MSLGPYRSMLGALVALAASPVMTIRFAEPTTEMGYSFGIAARSKVRFQASKSVRSRGKAARPKRRSNRLHISRRVRRRLKRIG